MTKILLIRHGETDWNVDKRLQGHIDIPLNAEGRRQAAALGRVLQSESLDAIIASDLQRALHTAQAIAQPRSMTVTIDAGLRERCYGAFEGLQYHEIEQRYPAAYAAWRAREPHARYPAGERIAETLDEFFRRATGAVQRIARQYPDRNIALVTHGGVLDCLYRHANALDFSQARDFDVLNASINRLQWHADRLTVMQWADIAHLDMSALDEVDR